MKHTAPPDEVVRQKGSSGQLIIFDTTLRDGEQSPGASMTLHEKVRIAKSLERMQVDVIEAGFAIASQGDFEAVKAVADTITESRVCSLARAMDGDIDRAGLWRRGFICDFSFLLPQSKT